MVQYQEWSTMLQASIHKVLANGEEPRAVLEGLQESAALFLNIPFREQYGLGGLGWR